MGNHFLSSGGYGLFIRLLSSALIAVSIAGLPIPANAQTEPPPGGITISRDVPTRRAYLPGEPGRVTAVETAPVQTILDAVSHAAVPLTDDEIAAVSAGQQPDATRPSGAINDALTLSQSLTVNGSQGSPLSSGALGGGMSGAINSAIGAGTGAIQDALSPLGSILPGGGQ